MPDCLIISSDAPELQAEFNRQAGASPGFKFYTSAEQALDGYGGEKILFGRPDMVAACLPSWPDIEWVQSTWAGVEPLLALGRRDYRLTVVKDIFGPQMSEYVFAHLLAHELKLYERRARQLEKDWFRRPSGTLAGKHIGIMGTGSIGSHIAQTARTFAMKVSGLSRSGAGVAGFDSVARSDQLHAWLENLDYLVCALPRTPATDRLLDTTALAKLPGHAYLVNVGRSNVLDEAALLDALTQGRLAGAALDVFDEEPLPPGNPLWEAPNLSITAHVAALSHPSLVIPIFLENLGRYQEGRELQYEVDFEAGY